MTDTRAGLTEAEIDEAIREPMTIHLLSAVDIVATIAALRRELADARNDLDLERMTRHVSEYVERAINHGGHRYTIGELRRMAEMSPDSDAARIIADLLATRDRLAVFAEMEHTADEALKAAHLARETATRELTARTEERDAARRELATEHALCSRVMAERDLERVRLVHHYSCSHCMPDDPCPRYRAIGAP